MLLLLLLLPLCSGMAPPSGLYRAEALEPNEVASLQDSHHDLFRFLIPVAEEAQWRHSGWRPRTNMQKRITASASICTCNEVDENRNLSKLSIGNARSDVQKIDNEEIMQGSASKRQAPSLAPKELLSISHGNPRREKAPPSV
ncbi:hypothetical protein F2P81_013819 [Scophthalmus maximus]|uniref:Uncharacterized protein n=1 Tax=Scophthalmus maximus TaxID=52904 RepID=A0A6A4SHZ5_SCOMX|nr:hypothetical protein F2P81_013819 [Scophthalmus maximus]